MCSIGWLKLTDSWILFKNRDRAAGDPINKENIFVRDKDLVGLANKKLSGITIGINKCGVGITTAAGPRNKVPRGKATEAAAISEKVLRECKTINDAIRQYKDLAKGLGVNYNVIIADSKQAFALEITPNRIAQKKSGKVLARTNHFIKLVNYNKDKEALHRSDIRLRKLTKLLRKIRNKDNLISVLRFHSSKEDESICKHNQWTETCASAIFEVRRDKITSEYVLNKSPCKGKFRKKDTLLNLLNS